MSAVVAHADRRPVAPLAERRKPKKAHSWARDPHDWYQEPSWCSAALLRVERLVGQILDPACGGGNIVRSCLAAGYRASGTDIVDRSSGAPWFRGRADFLAPGAVRDWPNVICNPPYFRARGTEAFARRAIEMCSGKVAIFADQRFLASGRRAAGLFDQHPPTRIWQIADRPSCPPGSYLAEGRVAKEGLADYVWIVWDNTSPSRSTEFGWLRRLA